MGTKKLQTLKGFRDFLPEEKRRRDFVLKKIKETFELFGFEPLETPALEYASVLLGKYGEEADKMVYTFKDRGGRKLALRYDQTVPLSRVLNQYLLNNPKLLRRYQIQPVWRADKPQKGRYREFLQCDGDIISNYTLFADAEILALFNAIYKNIGFKNLIIKVNDRQSLFSLLEKAGVNKTKLLIATRIIDKLEKKGEKEIEKEFIKSGFNKRTINNIFKLIKKSPMSANLFNILETAKRLGVANETLQYEPTLARGLDYYTGLIFEGFLPNYKAGSVGGGGRYDKLIGQLTGFEIKAVGFGLGFDRTVEAAKQAKLIPQFTTNAKVFVIGIEKVGRTKSLEITTQLRNNNINTELMSEEADFNSQLGYAKKKGIPYALIIGSVEAKANQVTLKDMTTGKQQTLSLNQVINKLK
jgi:histidyl-tRNA synthetase